MVKKTYNTSIEAGELGKIKVQFVMAMANNSVGVFSLGKNIDTYSGLNVADARKYKETPDDGYIKGLVNVMNDGNDIFFYTNASRLKYEITDDGYMNGLLDQLLHEAFNLAYILISKHWNKMSTDWVNMRWPNIGSDVSAEDFSEFIGELGELIGDDFIKMFNKVMK
jgi:hypothetical protein